MHSWLSTSQVLCSLLTVLSQSAFPGMQGLYLESMNFLN